MIGRIEAFLRHVSQIFSRSAWAIHLLRLSKLKNPTDAPGLVIVQIDGLSLTQMTRALQKGQAPFLDSLVRREHYVLHTFYSGLSSNTPAVQGELFYGVKGCIPAFYFVDRKLNQPVKMMDPTYVKQFQERFKNEAGLLSGGSSYSNIFSGGAQEAHFCFAQLGWGGVLHAINPLIFPFLIILYVDIFVRTAILLVVEFFIALIECIRGTLKGRLFAEELRFVWLRVLICIFLRELVVAGACMDIMRGLPIIHLNFLGYDEQAHCRGPSSRYAHWALQGIDHAIEHIHNVIKQSPYREYDLWVYGDHGQEKTTPYFIAYGRTLEQAVEEFFGKQKDSSEPEAIVTAMGPLGQIYVKRELEKQELERYARRLVDELKIPLVMIREGSHNVIAYTPKGSFLLPDKMADVFGEDHPFLGEFKEDLIQLCHHPDAGEFIIAGWCKGEPPISFPLEYGAHAAMGVEETRSFALLPMDTPLEFNEKTYLRPLDLRHAAQRFLNQEFIRAPLSPSIEVASRPLRLMSYNVHGCMGMDGKISAERIARVIARHNPDVVALQELDVGRTRSRGMDQAAKIAKVLKMTYHFHAAHSWEQEQYGNAILSRYPMALIKMAALPKLLDKNRYEPRGAVWVSMEFNGTKIQVINTHLSLWPQERLLQINALLSQEWLGHHDCFGPVIVCGDFNMLPGSTGYQKICQRLRDSQAILAGHRPHRTWSGNYPMRQIDYIFVTSEFQVKAISVPRTRLDKIASDHLPLIADLKFAKDQIDLIQNLKI